MIHVSDGGLPGLLLIEPAVHRDGRGFFLETMRSDELRAAGIDFEFVQHNQSRSTRGTVRGLHFQASPGQAKLVRVGRGAILDVAVDIRSGSDTFGRHVAVHLDDVAHRQLFVPPGFAHGFAVLSDDADVIYAVSQVYDPALEHGVAWDDPAIGIQWPFADPVLSDRDRRNPTLSALDPSLTRWDPPGG